MGVSQTTVVLSAQSASARAEALDWLGQGEVVAFPTDTVYGIGARVDRPAAVEQLYRIKGRPRQQAIPLLLAAVADLERVCHDVSEEARRLVGRFWPGGLTLVLWRRPLVPSIVTAGRPTVAVRLPDHDLPRELIHRLGLPLAATSANRSGAPSPVTAAQVLAQLKGRVPLVLDGGPCPGKQPSTIVDLTVDPPALLRAGPIPRGEIEAVLGRTLAGGQEGR